MRKGKGAAEQRDNKREKVNIGEKLG